MLEEQNARRSKALRQMSRDDKVESIFREITNDANHITSLPIKGPKYVDVEECNDESLDRSPIQQQDVDENQHFFESKRIVENKQIQPFCDESDSEETLDIGFDAAKFVKKEVKPQLNVFKNEFQ